MVTCPLPPKAAEVGPGTSHTVMIVIAAASAVIAHIVAGTLCFAHIRRYRVPKEQRQIIRLAYTPAIVASISFFQTLVYQAGNYVEPYADMYEAFALCALYMLYIQYSVPSGTFRSGNLFDSLELTAAEIASEIPDSPPFSWKNPRTWFGRKMKAPKDWPKWGWILVFQYPVTDLISVVIQETTLATGRFCATSYLPAFGQFWAVVIQSMGVGTAVFSILRLYARMKSLMTQRRGFWKLLSFKIIVAIRFFQDIIFSVLVTENIVKPSKTFSYDDISIGFPACLMAVEMALLSFGFLYTFSSSEYSSSAKPKHQPMPLGRAILDALNPSDLFAGIYRAFRMLLTDTGGSSGHGGGYGPAKEAAVHLEPIRHINGEAMTPAEMPYPGQSHRRDWSQDVGTEYSGTGNAQGYFQPPPSSPPEETGHLMAEQGGRGRAESLGANWNGQRYDRSRSPSVGRGEYPTQAEREMV